MNGSLAKALEKAKAVAVNNVIRSSALERKVREQLVNASFLSEVMRGWYLLTNPAGAGTTTLWFSNYWEFATQYLTDRFGKNGYCLSAESSLDMYSAQNIISRQLVIMTRKPSNQLINLPHDSLLTLYRDEKNFPSTLFKKDGLNLVPLAEALCRAAPSYFHNHSLNAEICLKLVPSAAEISRVLLQMQSPTSANRIAGAYRRMGEERKADQIIKDLEATGLKVSPQDPFDRNPLFLSSVNRLSSPYTGRIQAMWARMRSRVLAIFPEAPSQRDAKTSLTTLENLYNQDAYHSLSIEGYQVTPDLIQRIKEGGWNPDMSKSDLEQQNALIAKGYLKAFRAVRKSLEFTLRGENPGTVFSKDLQSWYRELFSPLAQAKLINATDLAGYRNHQVYISASRHIPPPANAILDSMDTLENLLISEESAAVRAVLGHFVFVFIHPYMDGNGRIGRFLMNLMLVSGGYNWTVIRTSERAQYMATLEKASTLGQIDDFAAFIASEMNYWKNEISKMPLGNP